MVSRAILLTAALLPGISTTLQLARNPDRPVRGIMHWPAMWQGGSMWQTPRTWWTATLALLLAGCVSGPLQENPMLLRPQQPLVQENPVYVPLGPHSYGLLFENVLDVVTDYFEIAYS